MIPISIRPLRTLVAVPVALAAIAFAPRAFADVLPPTACDTAGATAGQSCTTAGDGTEDGVCVSTTCGSAGHPLPDGGFSQGGTYPCLLCELVDAGPAVDSGPPSLDAGPTPAPDAGPVPVDAGPEATDAGAPATRLVSSSSCSVAVAGAGAGGGLALFGLGALGLAVTARSRGRNRRRS